MKHLLVFPQRKKSYTACGERTEDDTLTPRRVTCPECIATPLYEACQRWLTLEGAALKGSPRAARERMPAWEKYRELKEEGAGDD